MSTRFSFWLMLQGSTGNLLQELANNLAKKMQTPKFLVHVSIVPKMQELDKDKAILLGQKIAAQINSMVVILQSLGQSDNPHKTLYVNIDFSEDLRSAFAVAFGVLGIEPYLVSPHITLVYGEISEQIRKLLVNEINIPCCVTTLGSLAVVDTTNPNEAEWKIVAEFPLS